MEPSVHADLRCHPRTPAPAGLALAAESAEDARETVRAALPVLAELGL